jgi:hypothetical protein
MLALVLSAAAQESTPTSPEAPAAPTNGWGNPLPEEINYQGQLVDSNGLPQVGSYTMKFAIFSGPPDHTLLYTETQIVSTDQDGLFNLMIGAVQPGLGEALANGEAWLEVKLDDEILAPRQPVGSVAYALYAQHLVGGTGSYSVLVGGQDNEASGNWSVTAGGFNNLASGSAAFIGGGRENIASAWDSTVAGGVDNTASGGGAFIGAGESNIASAQHAIVVGGLQNEASNTWAVISGGQRNIASGYISTVGGGLYNQALGERSTIAGGAENTAVYTYTTVGGGYSNTAQGGNSTVGGGTNNSALVEGDTISGGQDNTAEGGWGTIGGGSSNYVFGTWSTVSGGNNNFAAAGGTVSGGGENAASSIYASVSGGYDNSASGPYAVVPGGDSNNAEGEASFATGRTAQANHDYTFVWSSSVTDFFSTDDAQFLIDAQGGVGINTNNPQTQLHVSDTIAGIATNLDAHVVAFQNDATSSPDVLALQVDGVTNPGASANFITFFDASGAIAGIEGNGSGGVAYNTSGADFAEYLPLASSLTTDLPPGTVLGLTGDTLNFNTAAAQRVMVVSSAPGFVGNADEADGNENMALVAFMGQVPVQVSGPVQAGDLLVASGLNDGTAVAVSPAELSPALANQIIGQALESSNHSDVTLINALVGVSSDAFWAARLSSTETELAELEARLADLEAALQQLTGADNE